MKLRINENYYERDLSGMFDTANKAASIVCTMFFGRKRVYTAGNWRLVSYYEKPRRDGGYGYVNRLTKTYYDDSKGSSNDVWAELFYNEVPICGIYEYRGKSGFDKNLYNRSYTASVPTYYIEPYNPDGIDVSPIVDAILAECNKRGLGNFEEY